MEISSLSKLCLESAAKNMPMWCQSALKEDFFKYMYTIGPFNGLSKLLIILYSHTAAMLVEFNKCFSLSASIIPSNMVKISLLFESHGIGCTSPIQAKPTYIMAA